MNVKEKLEQLINSVDKNGKRVTYKPEDDHRVYMDIDGSNRCIGSISFSERNILYHKYEDERNLFRKTNAWSINYSILPHVDMVWYESNTHDYCISRERALEFGEFFHFQDTTELKVYVPLKYWDIRHKGLQNVYPEEFKLRNYIGDSWYLRLKATMHSPLVTGISKFLKEERKTNGKVIYPDSDRVFKAFKLCSFEHTKVVILGQDPYIDGTANGLAFGYLYGAKKSYGKSLDIIYKEVERTIYNDFHLDYDYSLESWAKQGVLLLNTVLTVEKGKSLSHAVTIQNPNGIGWERFTKIVLYELMIDPVPKVFVLWGAVAKKHYESVKAVYDKNVVSSDLERDKYPVTYPHLVLTAPHPAYDLRMKDQFGDVKPDYPNTFSGNDHFNRANNFLKENNRKQIKW